MSNEARPKPCNYNQTHRIASPISEIGFVGHILSWATYARKKHKKAQKSPVRRRRKHSGFSSQLGPRLIGVHRRSSAFIGGQYGFPESANAVQCNQDYRPPINADSLTHGLPL
jgi:hypothetical protein